MSTNEYNIDLDNIDINFTDELLKKTSVKYNFLTHNSYDLEPRLISIMNIQLKREDVTLVFEKIFNDINISSAIELGIFEYSLIYVLNNGLADHFVVPIYYAKVNDLLVNLDYNNSNINNKTLYKAISKYLINAQDVAFMSPAQLHPDHWDALIKRDELRAYKRANIATTDVYTCYRCHTNKTTVRQVQTRGGDEPRLMGFRVSIKIRY